MRLFEHHDFRDIVTASAEHYHLSEGVVEKDYYVTEVLRIVAGHLGDAAIFKGGTSLSKGWNLIARFSEDVDVLVRCEQGGQALGSHAVDRKLKKLCEEVRGHAGLTWIRETSRTIGGKGREDRFRYNSVLGAPQGLKCEVLLEAGARGGTQPTEDRQLSSLVSSYLREHTNSVVADDLAPFTMKLLHFRRTFVEKLFTIHSKVEIVVRDGGSIGSYARHYYDLYCLALLPEVTRMLQSPEYEMIREDYNRLSRLHYGRDYVAPDGLHFRDSRALFPPTQLRDSFAREYTSQCTTLCQGSYPAFDDVLKAFEAIRDSL
ncbi:MAG TPA: nucleotidyl transferase AbiEii/AbiGii toxin family protein [Armatimonadota bacterium]